MPAFGLSADLFGVDAEADARREVMLAAAAVRLINYFVPTTELANQIADALEDGLALPAPGRPPERLAQLCRDPAI